MAKTKTAPIDEITIDIRATIWKFDMQRGYKGWSADPFIAVGTTSWDDAFETLYMALLPAKGHKSERMMACFYESTDELPANCLLDIAEDNGGASADLLIPWDILVRTVERLFASETAKVVPIPMRNGSFEIEEASDDFVVYKTECGQLYRLSRPALEALAR